MPEDADTVRAEERCGHARRVPEDRRLVGGFQEAQAKVLQRGVVPGLESEVVEGPGVLDGHRGLGSER